MHKLPRELTDCIIDLLHDDFETLKQVSFVSKTSSERSRYHLFETLSITHFKLAELGQASLVVPCKYVRKLAFVWTGDPVKTSLMLSNFRESKIHTLIVGSRQVSQLDRSTIRQCFSAFPCAGITSLEFRSLFCQTPIFLTFTSLFPNLDNLAIAVHRWNEDELPEMNEELMNRITFPSFRGRFQLSRPGARWSWDSGYTSVLHFLARMPIRFHTTSLYVNRDNLGNVSSFLDACAPTIRRILLDTAGCKPSLYLTSQCMISHATYPVRTTPAGTLLAPCVKLEELHLGDGFINIPGAFIRCVLDSISSHTLRHLTIELSDRSRTKDLTWKALDEALVRLSKRQEIAGRLVVEFSTLSSAEEVRDRLPGFQDQGPLIVGHRGRPSYW